MREEQVKSLLTAETGGLSSQASNCLPLVLSQDGLWSPCDGHTFAARTLDELQMANLCVDWWLDSSLGSIATPTLLQPPLRGLEAVLGLWHNRRDTWLILPVLICLSQGLSHASVSRNSDFLCRKKFRETANGSVMPP